MHGDWTEVTLLLTTVCNRRCPHCCYRIPDHEALGAAQHFPLSYFQQAAPFLTGLTHLYLSGGEPTLHPEFARLVPMLSSLCQPRQLILATNGARVDRHPAAIALCNEIWITVYPEDETQTAIAWLQRHFPEKTVLNPDAHRPWPTSPTNGQACARNRVAAYVNHRFYPCCNAPGIPGAASIPATRDWRVQLAAVPTPCDRCMFSGEPADRSRP